MVKPRSETSHQIRIAAVHSLVAIVAFAAAYRGAVGWIEHGFHIPNYYRVSPADDGSFILLLFGAFFWLYGAVTAAMAVVAARDAAHRNDTTRTI